MDLKLEEHQQLIPCDWVPKSLNLTKRYGGSLGEHGDGRLRGEFLAVMVGEKNYALYRAIKQAVTLRNLQSGQDH